MKGIDHIGVLVASVDDAKSVLVDHFGLKVSHEEDRPERGIKFAFLCMPNGSMIELYERPGAEELKARQGILDHLALEVDDLAPIIKRLADAGMQFDTDEPIVTTSPNGERRLISTLPASTFGVRIQLVENKH